MKKAGRKILSYILILSFIISNTFFGKIKNVYSETKPNKINIGEYIVMGNYWNEDIVWRCVGIDQNGPLMLCDKVLCYKSFDAKGNYGNYYRDKEGSNYWNTSSLRHWLNSEGDVDWSTQISIPSIDNVAYGYNSYDEEIGFLSSFSEEEKMAIKEVNQKTYLNNLDKEYAEGGTYGYNWLSGDYDTFFNNINNFDDSWYYTSTDKIFLLGPEQTKLVYDNVGGSYLNAKATQSAKNNDNSSTVHSNDEKAKYWLRLPGNNGMSYEIEGIIDSNDSFYYSSTLSVLNGADYQSIGVRPAFYINETYYSGEIYEENPYQELVINNLAKGGNVSASSSVQNAEYAVDGIGTTRWESEWNNDEWITVDLGKNYDINKVILYWEAAYGIEYEIQASTDNIEYKTVKNLQNQNGGKDIIEFEAVNARYVKMRGITRATEYGYSLYEMEVYGEEESVDADQPTDTENEKSIAIFSTEKSLSVNTGENMWLAFGLVNNNTGLVEEEWKKMAITVSNPTIISLSDYEKTEYGYSLEVIGKKEGVTNVTITDTQTGINTTILVNVYDSYVQTYSYAIDEMKEFYPNNQWENNILTNIYNLNGLYVNNYQCVKNGSKYNIDFDVYNSKYYAGAIDIYDGNGMWLGYEEINKYSDITSLWDTGEQAFYLISNTMALIPGGNESNLLTYEQESFSKHTHISLQIPEGGYFTISNNVATSPGTFFINALEILFDGAYTALDLVTSDSVKSSALSGFKKSAAKSLTERLIEARNEGLKNELKKKAQKVMLGTMQSEITKITNKFSQSELKNQLSLTDEACCEMANLAENILNSYNINWKHLFQSVTGVGESFFTQVAGPAGIALKGCFAITKSSNNLLKATQMATSTKKIYVTVYSSIEEGYINPYGVIVNTAGNMDTEAVLQVFKVSNEDAIDVILDSNNPLEKYEMYNICFVKDDNLVQPSGLVTVYIPIPEGMKGETCKVYRQENDNSWTILDAEIDGNYLVFETEHFSLYSVVGNMDKCMVYSLPSKVVYEQGDILETEGLILELNGNLISEGFVCEPTVLSNAGSQKIVARYGCITTEFYVTVNDITEDITSNKDNGVTTQNQTTSSTRENQETEEKVVKNSKITKIKKLVAKKKSIKITWKKVKGIKGYQLQYSISKKFKKAKNINIKKAKITSRTIKKLKSKKKYYVRIRTYITVNGKKYYSKWSKAKSKKTK